MKGRLINGCVIEAVPVRYPAVPGIGERNDVPHVLIRMLSQSDCHWTPAEARAFAGALMEAADNAEVKP